MPSNSLPPGMSQGTRSASPPSGRRDQIIMARRQDKVIGTHALAGSMAETNAELEDGADHDSPQESEHIKAPRWSTIQHPFGYFQRHPDSHSPALLYGESPRSSESEQHARMPDDTTLPSYLFSQTSTTQTPTSPPRQLSHQHASHQVGTSPYPTSSGDRSGSRGSPTSPTGSPDHSRSSRAGSRGIDLGNAAEHRSEPYGPPTSTEAHSPSRRRTRVLMTRVQSEALNRLWSQTMFPSTSERETLAQQIGLTARQVQVWFQNQRQKRRRERETNDAVQSQHPSDMLAHAMGPPTSTVSGYPPSARMTLMALSYPPPANSTLFNRHQSPKPMLPARALTHPQLQRPKRHHDIYRRGLSESHLQPAGRHTISKAPSAWRQRSPRADLLGGGHGSGNTTGSDESAGLEILYESQIGPHGRPRSMSTSQPHRGPSYSGNSPPQASRSTLLASSLPAHGSSFGQADGPSAESRLADGPYGYNPRHLNQGPSDARAWKSAPGRASQLPPSLTSMVIDSPFQTGAGPEAITLQPLNLRAVQSDESMIDSPTLPDRALSPRLSPRRRVSSDYDDGQAPTHISVADLIN